MTDNSFYSLSRISLEQKLAQFGNEKSKLRAKIFFREVYKEHFYSSNFPFIGISNDIKKWVIDNISFQPSVEFDAFFSSKEDGSVKFRMKLKSDGKFVESVLIPERNRLTLCVSTQVGCAQACRFCQTGRMGLLRSLSCSEIVGQLMAVERWRKLGIDCSSKAQNFQKITNIVYMGMGEPLDNLKNVLESASIFCDPQAFFLSHNKVTISTVGMLPALDEVLTKSPVCLALSLHSPFEEERTRVMPVNAKHSLTDVISCLKKHLELGTRDSFLVQYTLLRGINDTSSHANALKELLLPYNFKINLIPLNEHEGTSYRRPDLGHVYRFQQLLKQAGLVCTIRLSKGRDIQAACGQLIKQGHN